METFSAGALLVLAIVAFTNLRDGSLGDWFGAKFFNRAAPGTSSLATPGGLVPSSSAPIGPQVTEGFVAPLPGALINQPFRPGAHLGVDLSGTIGTPIHAAGAGEVTHAGAAGDYGLRIDIEHPAGVVTRYAHLDRIQVNTGDRVTAGQVIGTVGRTGNATGPHLHLELIKAGTPVDPCATAPVLCGSGVTGS